ncbi:IS891/IS1136/IS1341 transposase [Crocosphaera watsonii WH 0401]|uniref:IS891/IS1136/IS1341 transposase n=1 Tax=Crocosphaera watsonii WH 0401 TaxID=555881 RepID=T2J5E5_CROWT|nr:IS891/IS1136/IS1341 transposase [Crocosphaera watsonii WH 0401]
MVKSGINFGETFSANPKYPRFKSKHGRQSIQYPQNVKLFDNYLKIPKIGDVKAVIHRPIEGKIKTVTISKTVVINTLLLSCLMMVKKSQNHQQKEKQ